MHHVTLPDLVLTGYGPPSTRASLLYALTSKRSRAEQGCKSHDDDEEYDDKDDKDDDKGLRSTTEASTGCTSKDSSEDRGGRRSWHVVDRLSLFGGRGWASTILPTTTTTVPPSSISSPTDDGKVRLISCPPP